MSDAFVAAIDMASGMATIRLNRPDDGNKLLAAEVRALGRTIREYGCRPEAKIVVIRAGGAAFCLGRSPGPAAGPMTALEIREKVAQPILDLYADVRAAEVPVLAVVQGEARGFGCAMVGSCDLAIAADGALFSMPEMDGNLPPTLAMSAVLGKIPPKRLLHMVTTRRQVSAADALAMGLLSEVVPLDALDAAATATIACIADRSRPALCAVKEYLNVAPSLDMMGQARLAANLMSVVLGSA
jgi:enoyl-CoA hydratase/carnithine racemase